MIEQWRHASGMCYLYAWKDAPHKFTSPGWGVTLPRLGCNLPTLVLRGRLIYANFFEPIQVKAVTVTSDCLKSRPLSHVNFKNSDRISPRRKNRFRGRHVAFAHRSHRSGHAEHPVIRPRFPINPLLMTRLLEKLRPKWKNLCPPLQLPPRSPNRWPAHPGSPSC